MRGRQPFLSMLVGMTAISWIVFLAMTLCWPAVAVLTYFVRRSWRRHDERDLSERVARRD